MAQNAYELTTGPTSEPISLETFREHLRVNDDTENALLALYLQAARQQFESDTRYVTMTSTFKLHLECWHENIYLDRYPLGTVSSITYYDSDGVSQSFTDYDVNVKTRPAVIRPRSYPALSPYTRPAITITFTAGHATALAVPAMAKTAILLLATSYYENRTDLDSTQLYQRPNGYASVVNRFMSGIIGDKNRSYS